MKDRNDATPEKRRCRRGMRLARLRSHTVLARAALVAALVSSIVGVPGVTAASERADGDVPEGRIAFSSSRDGNSEIYAIDTDGTRLRRLTHNRVSDSDPSWHPSGDKVAFMRYHPYRDKDGRLRNNAEIWTKNLLTGTTRRLTHTQQAAEHDPQYSPDGTWIAFTKNLGAVHGYGSQIAAVRPRDGASHVVAVADEPDGSWLWSPSWSPDGASIAYVVIDTPPYRIAISEFDPSAGRGDPTFVALEGETSVCSDFESLGSLSWSPDGATIAYTAWPHVDPGALCMVPLAGGDAYPVVSERPIPEPESWAPQGGHIAGSIGSEEGTFVVVVDVESRVVERVVTEGGSPAWIVRPVRR